MKKLFIPIALLLSLSASAQSKANSVYAKGVYRPITKATVSPKQTKDSYIDLKGNVYQVFETEKGRLFIIKRSVKTDKEYRYYITTS